MVVSAGRLFVEAVRHGILAEVFDTALQVVYQQLGHVVAEAVADEHTLYGHVLAVYRERIGGYLPSAHTHPVRKVEDIEAEVSSFLEHPCGARNTGRTVVKDVEDTHLFNLSGNEHAVFLTGLVDAFVSLAAVAQEVVVLCDDLSAGPREVEGEGRHLSAEIVDVENQVFR